MEDPELVEDEHGLVELERGLWHGDADVYARSLADDALLVFPAPVGVLDRDQTVASIAGGPRWAHVQMSDVRVRRLAEGVATLTYAAAARRDGDASDYRGLVSSVYVRRDGGWRLALHQQSPDGP